MNMNKQKFEIFLKKLILNDQSLMEYDLSGHKIVPEEVKTLSHALRDNQNLNKLNLSSNEIGATGTEYPSQAFKNYVSH
ncbi:map-homologous protein [Anaeramoeba flamelloides]|uniref:Map-homologous protein n=1 Tax=Anaeramoeba flamelloides TaxID=1746091 RepID=A0ABQ8XB54_9EUKA|nr:map-homologous protein [Anaeramoeba flamelloides]